MIILTIINRTEFHCRVSYDLDELVVRPMFPRVGGWPFLRLIDAPSAFSFQAKGIPPTSPATESFLPKKAFYFAKLFLLQNKRYVVPFIQAPVDRQHQLCIRALLDPSSPPMHKGQNVSLLATSLFQAFLFLFTFLASIALLSFDVFKLIVVTFYLTFLIFPLLTSLFLF